MRQSKLSWVAILPFLIGGIYFWITMPEIYIGQIWVGVSVVLIIVAFFTWVARIGNQGSGGGRGDTIIFDGSRATSMELSGGAGKGAGGAVMEALREHGIDPGSGTVDLTSLSAARDAVLRALKEHGIDVAHHVAAANPATPIEDGGEPVERLLKLQQLKDANLITNGEYDDQRRRIIDNL